MFTGQPLKSVKKLNNIIGFISPLTNNFCSTCNRIRITSNGILYPCLGDNGSTNLIDILKLDDNKLSQKIRVSSFATQVAITGSSGKTSLKELLGQSLQKSYPTIFSKNSLIL